MKPVAKALRSAGFAPYSFDYQEHDTSWAAAPSIAACLGAYIHAVSVDDARAGGAGKVVVVGHSMGGLATLFASSPAFATDSVGDVLEGVVTLDTPFLGSPFGDQAVARAFEGTLGKHPMALLPLPKPGTDASICLASHAPPSNRLPHGCAAAPYLQANVPITQIAGDITVRRTLFGIPLYDIDLSSDGVVPVESSHGYLHSSGSRLAPLGTITEQPTVACTIDFDQVASVAAAQGLASTGIRRSFAGLADVLSPNMFTDALALDEIEAGSEGPQLVAFLAAANLAAPCSHTGMLTDQESLTDVVQAVRIYSSGPAAGMSSAPTSKAVTPSTTPPVASGPISDPCSLITSTDAQSAFGVGLEDGTSTDYSPYPLPNEPEAPSPVTSKICARYFTTSLVVLPHNSTAPSIDALRILTYNFASASDARQAYDATRTFALSSEIPVDQGPVGVADAYRDYVTRAVTDIAGVGQAANLGSLNDAYVSLQVLDGPDVISLSVDSGWQDLSIVSAWIRAIKPHLVAAAHTALRHAN